MANETDVAVTTGTPSALKSTDTSSKANIPVEQPKVEPKAEPAKEVEPKVSETETPPEGEDAPDADSLPARKRRVPRWMQERLERERQVTEARTREAVLREFQQQQPKTEPRAQEPELKTLEDFDFDQGKYTDYLVERKLEMAERKRAEQAELQKRTEAAESFKARIDAFEERAGDGAWEDIEHSKLNRDPKFKPLVDLFWGDEHDLDIAHHLAQNIKDAERIVALPRLQQVKEIAKLADQFDGSQKAVSTLAEAPPKKTTTAPPPVKTVSGGGKPVVDINDPSLTTEQRIKLWRQRKAG
jgi:hypothetical protein